MGLNTLEFVIVLVVTKNVYEEVVQIKLKKDVLFVVWDIVQKDVKKLIGNIIKQYATK